MFRPISTLPAAAAAITAATVIAACGSNSPGSPGDGGHPTQAHPAQAAAQQNQQDAVRFAQCMRSHGVPNFPDPERNGLFDKSELRQLGISESRMRAAGNACPQLDEGGGGPGRSAADSQAQIAAALAFARCLRSHGFPSFPDPTSSGQLTPEMVAGAGINLHQPAVLQAADGCVSVTHGFITKAAVARAVNSSDAAGH